MTSDRAELDVSFELGFFRPDARALDDGAFAARHGSAFLVLSSDGGLQVPDGPRKTVAIDARSESADGLITGRYRVFSVRKSGRSMIERFVSVGRTRTNDVLIPDVSLSKFHAFFVEEAGVFKLQDARSRNGTFVDGKRIAAQGEGPPTALRSGSLIRFGAIDLTFLDAASLRKLAIEVG